MAVELAVKKFEVINKSFLTVTDISVLLDCGKSKALEYRKKFVQKQNYNNDYFKTRIPLKDFIDYYKIDIDIIRKNYILTRGNNNARVN